MAPRSERICAAITAALLLAMLVVGARLHPEPQGHSTHEQLGLLPCGFFAATGHPCPTCGMTTAVSYAAHRSPIASFLTQPFGALIAIGAAVGFWGCLHVAVFGSRLWRVVALTLRPRTLWVGLGLALASWAYKLLTCSSPPLSG